MLNMYRTSKRGQRNDLSAEIVIICYNIVSWKQFLLETIGEKRGFDMIIKRFDVAEPHEVYATMKAREGGGIILYTDTFAVELSTENLLDMTGILMEQMQEKEDKYKQANKLLSTPLLEMI